MSKGTQSIAVLTVAFLSLAVTLSAAPPSYFRGFTLIALKENREGDKEEDHAGTFQVRGHSLPQAVPVSLLAWQSENKRGVHIKGEVTHLVWLFLCLLEEAQWASSIKRTPQLVAKAASLPERAWSPGGFVSLWRPHCSGLSVPWLQAVQRGESAETGSGLLFLCAIGILWLTGARAQDSQAGGSSKLRRSC